jgi:hypothetical protein
MNQNSYPPADSPFLVGISGAQGAGKTILGDLLADSLRRRMKLDVRRRALADPLREMAEVVAGDPHFHKSRIYPLGPQGAPMLGREVLQRLGTEICREAFRPDIWIHLLLRWAEQSGADIIVVDDARFPNEGDACGFRFFLESDNAPEQEGAAHASESNLPALRAAANLVVRRNSGVYMAEGPRGLQIVSVEALAVQIAEAREASKVARIPAEHRGGGC